jgi:molecular chaperone DnaK
MSGTSDLPETIVIDVGAGAIRAAVVAAGGSWLVTEPTTGLACWPAAAHWDGEQLRVGTPAERAHGTDPDGYWSELTRCLTIDAAVPHGQRAFRPIDMLTALLRAVVAEAQRRSGATIDRALLTVPAKHRPGDRHRARLIAAAEAAGLGIVELLPEPVAAAGLIEAAPPGALVLVCDLGAGSFDATLLQLGAEPEILGADTIDGAGRDLDALLEEHIYRDAQPWLGPLLADAAQQPGVPAATRLGIAFTDFARRLKHRLTDAPVAQDLMLPSTPVYVLSRDELAGAVSPLLDRLVACCERLLYRYGAKPGDLAAVALAGGGARLPAVAARLAQALGQPPYRLAEPELMVLSGAVRWLTRRGRPVVAPEPLPAGTAPLAFAIPSGRGRLVRWLVAAGEPYTAGSVLARVRLPNGALWDLIAAEPGRLDRVLVDPDSDVSADQWLALAVP